MAIRSQFISSVFHPWLNSESNDTEIQRGGDGGSASALDALAPGIGAEDLEPIAALAHGLERPLDRHVARMALDVDEEEVGGIARSGPLGEGEGLDPGHVDGV